MPDYYSILGVSPDATQSEIKQAWRIAAQLYHPDRHQGASETLRKEAERRFIAAREAFEVLSDAVRRSAYDAGHPPADSATQGAPAVLRVEPDSVDVRIHSDAPSPLTVVSTLSLENPTGHEGPPEVISDSADFTILNVTYRSLGNQSLYPLEITLTAAPPRQDSLYRVHYLVNDLAVQQSVRAIVERRVVPEPPRPEPQAPATVGRQSGMGKALAWLAGAALLLGALVVMIVVANTGGSSRERLTIAGQFKFIEIERSGITLFETRGSQDPTPLATYRTNLGELATSRDGRWLARGTDPLVLLNLESGATREFPSEEIFGPGAGLRAHVDSFSPNAEAVVIATDPFLDSHTIIIVDLNTGEVTRTECGLLELFHRLIWVESDLIVSQGGEQSLQFRPSQRVCAPGPQVYEEITATDHGYFFGLKRGLLDGRFVADIWRVRTDGFESEIVFRVSEAVYSPMVASSDAAYLAIGGRELWLYELATGKSRRLAECCQFVPVSWLINPTNSLPSASPELLEPSPTLAPDLAQADAIAIADVLQRQYERIGARDWPALYATLAPSAQELCSYDAYVRLYEDFPTNLGTIEKVEVTFTDLSHAHATYRVRDFGGAIFDEVTANGPDAFEKVDSIWRDVLPPDVAC